MMVSMLIATITLRHWFNCGDFMFKKYLLSSLILCFCLFSQTFASFESDDEAMQHTESLSFISMNPAKGFTVWKAPAEEVTFSWPSYGDFRIPKRHVEMLDGELEITISPFTIQNEYHFLIDGIHRYDQNKVDPAYLQGNQVFTIDGYDFDGLLFGESVVVYEMPLIDNIVAILQAIEAQSFAQGGRRIFMSISNHKNGLAPLFQANQDNLQLSEILQGQGYVDIPGECNFITGDYQSLLIKEIGVPNHNGSVKLEWEPCPDDEDPTGISEKYGIFVRDAKGIVQGGAWGSIEKYATHPHSDIAFFYMDEIVRGAGLGKLVINELEKYVKSRGISLLTVGTSDHYAPWFYERMGFKRYFTIPKYFKGLSGEYLAGYDYCKSLD